MTPDEIRTLVDKRGIIKASLTRIKNTVDKFNSDTGDIYQLKTRLTHLKTLMPEFNKIKSQIEISDTVNRDKHLDERGGFEDKYFDTEATILKIIDAHETISCNNSLTSVNSSQIHQLNNIRLPQLNLPIFEGSYTNWTSFSDTFKVLIHDNSTYSNIEKFHYLRSSLKGDALKTVESIIISEKNYQTAWEVLKSRYENKRLIIHEHVIAILNSPTIQRGTHIVFRQLADNLNINIAALKALQQPVEQWDAVIVPSIVQKFDFLTRKEWESTLSTELPTLTELIKFLERKCLILESLNISNKQNQQLKINQPPNHNQLPKTRASSCFLTNNIKLQCALCNIEHQVFKCPKFLSLSVKDRIKTINEHNLCSNCLRSNHDVTNCKASSCRKCNQKHHTLIHNTEPSVIAHVQNNFNPSQVLLSTARILVKNNTGNWITCRALLDVGSQTNLITKDTFHNLRLPAQDVNIPINGVNETSSLAKQIVDVKFKSVYDSKHYNLKCLVIPKITDDLPTIPLYTKNLEIPTNLKLADPNFNKSEKIDILLGADIFWSLLKRDQISGNPHFQETALGWLLGGNVPVPSNCEKRAACFLNSTLQEQVAKFWELEECPDNKSTKHSPEEQECLNHFMNTHKRNKEGRFVVRLPFKSSISNLGNSKYVATKRLNYLESKLNKNRQLKHNYDTFMREYEDLHHMQPVNLRKFKDSESNSFYLPHHAIIKESSSTSKTRVVFDASAKTSSGLSLNDVLMNGPKLQDDLFTILIRFRTYQYVLSADIAKMFRQILVADEDRSFQRILWRYDQSDPVQIYELNTVTYGTACAPFLAVQCLQQLALDEKEEFPVASQVLSSDFYMDDLLTGTNELDQAIKLKAELQSLLSRGGFELRKWTSNESSLLPTNNGSTPHMINLEKDGNTKLLGLWWNCNSDQLNYVISNKGQPSTQINHTKRSILSNIAQIFDPLGLLSPMIIKAKLIIQKLWQLKHNWDEPIPQDLNKEWSEFVEQCKHLHDIKINRKVINFFPADTIELHGFSDSSERAFGACVYLRAINKAGQASSHLLCSKSRVAPLKVQTIPRLELCGALLLAKLINIVKESLKININQIFYWTDSTIVLAWLTISPNNLNTFVGNRVAQIQSLTDINSWNHVHTNENPADIITRGCQPINLVRNNFWFHGPEWLHKNYSIPKLNVNDLSQVELPEFRTRVHKVSVPKCDWLLKYSKFIKLQRVTAYCLRFINNMKDKTTRLHGELKCKEIENATVVILKLVQLSNFSTELADLKANKGVARTSCLKTLNPFVDKNLLIRVGGRLRNATVCFDKKHPIVLPKHHVTELIIRHIHETHMHAGNTATLAAIRELYWPISGRNQVRKVLYNCVPCFRANPKELKPSMGDLPASRCELSYPFINCGVDYAGPIQLREGFGRGKRIIKAYICIFICFATKAVHLELVGNLTTCFLNALKRFVSRRGIVKNIYSDNAKNFVGADKELKVLTNLFQADNFQTDVINNLAINQINWHFIPSRSPHFGGLWESGVKRIKYHLKRVAGNAMLTSEEMYTLLACIEACLNSRPLVPISNDPNDLAVLTPGHFLIGRALKSIPEPSITTIRQNRLSRWQFVEQLRQHFWKRWVTEYLAQLHPRPRGNITDTSTLQPGTLVILREKNIPPLGWKYGRIVKLHLGADGVTRVVSVKVENGVTKRAVRNISVLPVNVSATKDAEN